MICPKCEEGEIKKVSFKGTKGVAYICDFCNSMWLEEREIDFDTGSVFSSISNEKDTEYSVSDLDKRDQEHQSVAFVNYK